MSDELQRRLASAPVPDAADATARARAVVLAAASARGAEAPSPRGARRRRTVIVAAVLGAALAAAGPPGAAVGEWVQRQIAPPPPPPAPEVVPARRLPADGRLLLHDAGGLRVVGPRGEPARLGRFDGAAWSPRGLFVVAWRGDRLAALAPDGAERWSIAAPARIRAARWSPDGYRIAFVTADGVLRVVAGDGSGARPLASAGAVAPAWQPGEPHTVAYVGSRRRVFVRDADRGAASVWGRAPEGTRALSWSGGGRRLAAIAPEARSRAARGRPGDARTLLRPPGGRFTAAAFAPAPGRTRLARVTRRNGRSTFTVGAPGYCSIRSRHSRAPWCRETALASARRPGRRRVLAVRVARGPFASSPARRPSSRAPAPSGTASNPPFDTCRLASLRRIAIRRVGTARRRPGDPVENPATGAVSPPCPTLAPDEVARARRPRARRAARLGGARLRGARPRPAPRAEVGRRQLRPDRRRRSSPRPARRTTTRCSTRSATRRPPSASGPSTPPATSPTRRSARRSPFVLGRKLVVALPRRSASSASSGRGTTR